MSEWRSVESKKTELTHPQPLRGQAMNIPIPAETPDPNIDDPTLPPAVPDEEPDEPPIKPTVPPTVGDPPSDEPPVKA